MPPGPPRRLTGQPAGRALRLLLEHDPQRGPAPADPVPGADLLRTGHYRPAGQDHAAPDRRDEAADQLIEPAVGLYRGRPLPQGGGQQLTGRVLPCERLQGQLGPRGQRGGGQVADGPEIGGQPGPQVFPEQGLAQLGQRFGRRGRVPLLRGLTEAGVQAEQLGEVIRLVRDGPPEDAPEAGDLVGVLAPRAAFPAEVRRGVRRAVEHEHLGVLGVTAGGQAEGGRGRAGAGASGVVDAGGVVGDRPEGAQPVPATRQFHWL